MEEGGPSGSPPCFRYERIGEVELRKDQEHMLKYSIEYINCIDAES
jgi:hypothetical protein